MCQVPSWVRVGEAVLFLTDKDAKREKMDYNDATGHSAIRTIFKESRGRNCEGLSKTTPKSVVSALENGEMNGIVSAGEFLVKNGRFTMPFTSIGDDLDLHGRCHVTFPRLRKIVGIVTVSKGCTLVAPMLTQCGYLENHGKILAPKLKTTPRV